MISDVEKIKDRLFARTGKGIKYDLTRMFVASRECGNAHTAYKSIHVAGTNGKGSTCTYLESMLRHQGLKTGLYTSPHLLRFEERFLIDGKPVAENQWVEVYQDLQGIIDTFDLTFFEATTLMAFELFKRNQVQWAVIETGLGGRLDATNIIVPSVSVITALDMDHKDLLGDTILQIAHEKFGIIKKGVPAVVAGNKDQSVMHALRATCSQRAASLTVVTDDNFNISEHAAGATITNASGSVYEISMNGSFQVINTALALCAFERCGFTFDERARRGLRNAFIPGRLQQFEIDGKTLIIDVGHNRHAASALISDLSRRYKGKEICIVAGIMKDKDYSGMIQEYLTFANKVILAQPAIARAASVEQLRAEFKHEPSVQWYETVADACRAAFGSGESIICITGSFYTVGEACTCLEIDPFSYNKN